MKTFICGFTLSLGVLAASAQAEQMITVDGTEFPLSTLMQTCQGMIDQPAEQMACFSDLSQLLENQSGAEPVETVSVPDALQALRAVAQYQDEDSGLFIAGADCTIQIIYYNNYFHISRRNISEIDLFSAQFDASRLQFDQTAEVRGAQAPLVSGSMDAGATAVMHGGLVLDSDRDGFTPRSPRVTLDTYAVEVIGELAGREGQDFEFVLVHPQRSDASTQIWDAFETFLKACR